MDETVARRLKGNVWLHREIPGTDHLSCPDLAPNGLPYKQIIDKANQILEGGTMSNAGDEVWNWAYKPAGKNATPGGNMYNLLAYELPQRVRDSIMQYSYKAQHRAATSTTPSASRYPEC